MNTKILEMTSAGVALCKILAVGLLLSLASNTYATTITTTDIITNWTSGDNPTGSAANGSWFDSSGTIQGTENHAGSLVSDVIANTNFSFSVNSTAIDDDTFGLIWGFQDLSNHYRFSWGQDYGENGVGSGPSQGWDGIYDGFKIIKEEVGVSSVLFSSETEYVQGNIYTLNVMGTAAGFNVNIDNLTTSTSIFSQVLADTTFTSGKVGIHELYQGSSNIWTSFDLNGTSVPEPSILAIFALGIMGLVARRFKK